MKESHEGKSLIDHINECKKIASGLLDFYGLTQFRFFIEAICELHDIGKLSPQWSISQKKRPHVEEGIRYLCNPYVKDEIRRRLFETTGIDKFKLPYELLLFFVKVHHRSLSSHYVGGLVELKRFIRAAADDFKIDLIDAYGIFKLADILSASSTFSEIDNLLATYTRRLGLGTFEKQIRENIISKCKEKGVPFDSEKFDSQRRIAQRRGAHVLIAPTGWGKTSFSLMRALSGNPKKIFYVLPTITAIRKFYCDLSSIFPNDVGEYFYFADVELLRRESAERDPTEFSRLVDFYRLFLPRVNITTIDQMFFSFLGFGKYHLRRFSFRDAFIIFDEFHLFTPEMIHILKAIFELYGHIYKFNIILMSATPSKAYIDFLRDTINKYIDKLVFSIENYHKLYGGKRHRINLRFDRRILDDDIIESILSHYESGKRILVIVNTVERAVKLYDEITGRMNRSSRKDVVLIHSRFAVGDRYRQEERIDNAKILVATQVAEVSLDVSFDILYTEIAPIPALIQRFGRVNRYAKSIPESDNVVIMEVPSPSPYSARQIDESKKLLRDYIDKINNRGEEVLLDILEHYDCFIRRDLQRGESVYSKTLEALQEYSKFFYAFSMRENDAILVWRKNVNVLAIPELYLDKAKNILADLRKERNYSIRKRKLAELKKYFIPTPWYLIAPYRRKLYDNELNMYLLPADKFCYDPHRGLLPRDL